MFSKRLILWTAALVVAVLGVTSAVASAQRPDRRRGFGPRGSITYGVELTPEQREQVRAIMDEGRQQRRAADPAANLNRELELELLADNPDQARLDSLRAQIAEAQQARLQKWLEVRRRVAQVLTPEQRAQARENLAKHR